MDTNTLGRIMLASSAVLLVLLIIGGLYFIRKKEKSSKKADINVSAKKKKNGSNYLIGLYNTFLDIPFLKQYLLKVQGRIQILYPADEYEIIKTTSKILLNSVLAGIAGIIVTIVFAAGDVWFIMAGFALTLILISSTANNSFNKLEMKLLKQLRQAIALIRHAYHQTNSVTTALGSIMDELPYEIELHMQNIYEIINDPDIEMKMDEYIEHAPNKYVMTFLSIAASITQYGDKTVDGQSLFLKDMDYLKEEVNEEILKKEKIKEAFSYLTILALVPVLAIKPIASWASNTMPDISPYYQGTYGMVGMIIIFVVGFISYYLIVSLRDEQKVVEKDNGLFVKLSSYPIISQFLTMVIAKHYKRYEDIDNKQQVLGDQTGPKAFLLKQIVIAVSVFLVANVLFLSSTITTRANAVKDWADAFEETVTPSEEFKEQMRVAAQDMSNEYIKRSGVTISTDQLVAEIMGATNITQKSYATIIAQEIIKRNETYQNTYFKYYYLLIAIALSICGFMIPVWMQKFKNSFIQMKMQEEVMQFQALMLILMYMDGQGIEKILDWMERFSFCFKQDILEARINLPSGLNETLETLKESQTYEPFRDFVDNLISIDQVGIQAAFEEIETDREYNAKERNQTIEINLKKKVTKATILGYVPFVLTMILYLFVPIIRYAINTFNEVGQYL